MSLTNISSRAPFSLAPKSETSTLFFPHWVECPYRFHVRLVWAALMDSGRRKQAASAGKIEKLTGLSDNTIRLAIRDLVKDNLCTIQKGTKRITGIDLIEPADDARYWAPKAGEGWLNQIAYTVVPFTPGMPAIQSVLLAKIATLRGKQSYRGLSEMLGVCKRSVKKALNALITSRAIKLAQLPDGYFTIDVADMHPSIKGARPFVNNHGTASEPQDVADSDPRRRKAIQKMSQICHRDVADMSGDVADVSQDVADMHPSIKGIRGTIKVAQDKSAFLEGVEEEAARGKPEESRRLTEEDFDRAYAKHLCKLGCSSRAVQRILALWKEKMRRMEFPEAHCLILDYSASYLAQKKVANPSGFIIAELQEQLGIVKRKPPIEKPKRQLTEEELEYRRMWQEHDAMEREGDSLCIDMSMPWQH